MSGCRQNSFARIVQDYRIMGLSRPHIWTKGSIVKDAFIYGLGFVLL